MKNDLEQAKRLEPHFDFALLEECFQFHECGPARRFVAGGKTVVDVEYELPRSEFCARARELRFAAMRKRLSLGPWRRPCA
jgi:Glycoside-hydrolase family GH114